MKCQKVIFAARSRAGGSVTQVVPRNQEKATSESQMLVESILCRESLRWPKLPVSIGHKRRGDGERTQGERAEPAPVSGQDGDGCYEFQSNHGDRKGHRRR